MKKLNNFMLFILIVSIGLLAYRTNGFDIRRATADSGFDSSWDSGGGGSWDSGGSSWDSGGSDSGGYYGEGLDVTTDEVVIIIVFFVILVVFLFATGEKTLTQPTRYVSRPPVKDDVAMKIEMYHLAEYDLIPLAYSTYVDIQKAWMDNDINKVKDKLSDELYNTYKMQLLTLKRKNQSNVMSDFKYISGYIYEIDDSNDNLSISIFLNVNCKDYLIDIPSGKVLRGNKNKLWNYEYTIDFLLAKDKNDILNKCPNCGAGLDTEKGSRLICPYCRTLLVRKSPTLIMTRKHMNNQK